MLLFAAGSAPFEAQAPIHYTFTFPEPEHRWMQVEAVFHDVGARTLELRMSRSSPGRYSLHDFAKNVYDVHALGADGRELALTRPDPYGWNATVQGGSVTVRYKVFGDRVDGTYLGIDRTHAHINMPAAIMWAHGFDDRPATLTFVEPADGHWQVATQLHPGGSPLEYTAPNLQYLMDSPVEFGLISMREFAVGSRTFRFSAHHTGTEADLDSFVKDVERIVAQEGAIYGEFPAYEPGAYTFLGDYLPNADGDGMEHRNSTVMTARATIAGDRLALLDIASHEFFHCWNVERIRPRSLEPFDFDRANMSGELWLAEGFTQYYGSLVLTRAGLEDAAAMGRAAAFLIGAVRESPAHLVRSAEEMSRMAPFIDGGRTVDRTNWANTVTSYYPFGGAIALALDLSLRGRSESRVTLDDYMRAMWRKYGKPGGSREGYVDHPYTIEDAEATLAEVSGDRAFARDFFSRYVHGHEVADYARLLAPAGFVMRPHSPGAPTWGRVRLEARRGVVTIASPVPAGSPAYAAGLEEDDEIAEVDGRRVETTADVDGALRQHKPGDRLPVTFVDRGQSRTTVVTLSGDEHMDVVPAEAAGGDLTPAQKTFRDQWLGPKQ